MLSCDVLIYRIVYMYYACNYLDVFCKCQIND